MKAPQPFTSPCKGEVGREAAGMGSKERRFSRTIQMTDRARRLRANMTNAERKLGHALRRNQMNGLNFRRQHPVRPFTLDFHCPSLRLGIEIDGGQHAGPANQLKDQRRTVWMSSKGITVIRFWNNDVLGNLSGVLTEISRVTAEKTMDASTPFPTLPLSGGGRAEAGL